jgi:uncharacterized membrane protein
MFVATEHSAAHWVKSLSFCTGPILVPAFQWPDIVSGLQAHFHNGLWYVRVTLKEHMLRKVAITALNSYIYRDTDHASYFLNKELCNTLFKKSSFQWGLIYFGRTRDEYDKMGCDLEAVHLEPECAACLFSA